MKETKQDHFMNLVPSPLKSHMKEKQNITQHSKLGKLRHSRLGRVNQDTRAYTRTKIRMCETYRLFHLLTFISEDSDRKEKKKKLKKKLNTKKTY